MKNASVKIILDGKPMSNGNHRVCLRIIKNQKKKVLSLGLECIKSHFQNEQFTKQHKNYKVDNVLLTNLKNKANQIIRDYHLDNLNYSLEEFANKFRGQENIQTNGNVIQFFDVIADEMITAGRISNAKAYNDTKNSLIKFYGEKFEFADVTAEFLQKYEVFLRGNNSSNGGISFKMREFKALINKAISRKLMKKELYPFTDYKFSKLKSESSKTALSIEEFKKIRDVDVTEHPHLKEAYHYFMFSIFTRGMNFKDMMLLKWSDISDNRIQYTRSKTKGKLNLEIIQPAQEILNYYSTRGSSTKYVFPILSETILTPQQIANRKHKVLSRYNKKLKEIGKIAGVEKTLTSYVARHSFATLLKMSGTPIEKISEMMGHSDVSITISYLKEFSNESLDNENRKFLEF